MSRLLFTLFAILVILSTSTLAQECPQNQIWNSCGNACPPTCKDPNPQICTMQCVAGCECTGGLVRNEAGGCVPLSDC